MIHVKTRTVRIIIQLLFCSKLDTRNIVKTSDYSRRIEIWKMLDARCRRKLRNKLCYSNPSWNWLHILLNMKPRSRSMSTVHPKTCSKDHVWPNSPASGSAHRGSFMWATRYEAMYMNEGSKEGRYDIRLSIYKK